jgi:hypothetical protein
MYMYKHIHIYMHVHRISQSLMVISLEASHDVEINPKYSIKVKKIKNLENFKKFKNKNKNLHESNDIITKGNLLISNNKDLIDIDINNIQDIIPIYTNNLYAGLSEFCILLKNGQLIYGYF